MLDFNKIKSTLSEILNLKAHFTSFAIKLTIDVF